MEILLSSEVGVELVHEILACAEKGICGGADGLIQHYYIARGLRRSQCSDIRIAR